MARATRRDLLRDALEVLTGALGGPRAKPSALVPCEAPQGIALASFRSDSIRAAGPVHRCAAMVGRWRSQWGVSASLLDRPGVPEMMFDLMLRGVMGARLLRRHCPGTLLGCWRRHPMPIAAGCPTGRAAHVLLLKCFDDRGAFYGEVREGQSTGRANGAGVHDWMRRPATHSGGSFSRSVSCRGVAPAGSGRRSHAGIFRPAWERAPEIQSICSRSNHPRKRPVNPAGK